MTDYHQLISETKDQHLQRLFTVLKYRSVSADSAFKDELQACADWLCDYIASLGAKVTQVKDYGRPIVFAEFMVDSKLPTLLLYGHYDVQPAGDVSLWRQEPFDPLITDRKLIARGSSDNKGPFMVYLAAIEILQKTGKLPVNIKIVFEGEEESSGSALFDFVQQQPERLKCDLIISTDAVGFIPGVPALTYGTRGLVYKQIDLTGPIQDLHSGTFGGAVPNPANALVHMLAKLFDENGKINIPHVYDKVRPIEPDERKAFAELPFNEKQYCEALGITQTVHEQDFSPIEQIWCRPNLAINGLLSGYTGEGAKTVLPSKATAKVSMRLVPDQDAQEISTLMDEAFRSLCPKNIKMEIQTLGLAQPYIGPRTGPANTAAEAAIEKIYNKKPVRVREGGTLPIMSHFKKYITENILIIGLARPDSAAHGPNEYFHLDDFERGIEMTCTLFDLLAVNIK